MREYFTSFTLSSLPWKCPYRNILMSPAFDVSATAAKGTHRQTIRDCVTARNGGHHPLNNRRDKSWLHPNFCCQEPLNKLTTTGLHALVHLTDKLFGKPEKKPTSFLGHCGIKPNSEFICITRIGKVCRKPFKGLFIVVPWVPMPCNKNKWIFLMV